MSAEGEYTSLGPPDIRPEEITDPDGISFCECGECWWRLEARPMDPPQAIHGAMTLSHTGLLKSYIGRPFCVGCGKPWDRR